MTGLEVLFAAGAAGAGGAGMSGMAMIGTMMSVVGTAVSAMGTIAAGRQQQQAANAQAEQLKFQGKQFEARGKWERAQQRQKADLAKKRKQILISARTARDGASGFLPGDHSSSIAISDLERWGSFDEFNELAGGEMAQFDNKIQAQNKYREAKFARFEGAAAASSARTSAMGTMIGGIGTAFGRFNPSPGTASATGRSGGGVTTASYYGQYNARPG